MSTNEKPKGIWNPVWPTPRAALLRLALITGVLFPLSWAIKSLLVGTWDPLENHDEESYRHFTEWTVIWAGATSVIFLASLLPVLGWMHRFLGWLFSPRIVRRSLIALVWIVTLAALFYAEENWRGARAWNKYRRELEANGAQLDLAAFIPKPIPDEQNFAAMPVIKSWFVEIDRNVYTNTPEKYVWHWHDDYERAEGKVIEQPQEKGSRHFLDLGAWENAFAAGRSGQTNSNQRFVSGKLDLESRRAAAPAVLEGLKTNEAVLAELRVASQRPLSRYPVVYDMDNPPGIFLPHLINVRNACQRLQLRACAELAAGRSDDALADVKLMLYLADSVKEEPFLITYLLRIACVQIAIQPVWEGLAGHAWSDSQLQELEARFQQYNFVADMKRPFDGEMAEGVLIPELVRKKGLGYLIALMGGGQATMMDIRVANWAGAIIPHGWYSLEQVNSCKLFQMQLDGAFDPASKTISPARIEANMRELNHEFSGGSLGRAWGCFLHHRAIAEKMLPSNGTIMVKAAAAQIAVDQAALACALERFRLANGSFPDKLEMLVPQFIPQLPADPLTGESYKYRRRDDGQFVLYSVGWNQKDDGGEPGKKLFDEKQGDWVWQYPAR